MKDRKRFRGNQLMIAKIMNCAEQSGEAAAHAERKRFRDNIGALGRDRRAAAQEKRARRAARRVASEQPG
jgi:hypothetical protein